MGGAAPQAAAAWVARAVPEVRRPEDQEVLAVPVGRLRVAPAVLLRVAGHRTRPDRAKSD